MIPAGSGARDPAQVEEVTEAAGTVVGDPARDCWRIQALNLHFGQMLLTP
ncbi:MULTISPECIES: hypothetical protein [unclassified Streptomyces]